MTIKGFFTVYSRIKSARGSLYEILRKSEAYFKLCCGQAEARIRSARGGYTIPHTLKDIKCNAWLNHLVFHHHYALVTGDIEVIEKKSKGRSSIKSLLPII